MSVVLSWLITEKNQRSCRGSDWGLTGGTMLFTGMGKQQQQIKRKERDVFGGGAPGVFVHVELWCSWLLRGPLALSVAQRLPWGSCGFRGSHIAGGNYHRRTEVITQAAVWARRMWEGGAARGTAAEEKESGKRSPGSEKEMGGGGGGARSTGLAPLRKQRNDTVSRAAKRTSTFPLDVTRVLVGAYFQCGGQDRSPVARAQCDPSEGMRKQAEHVSHLS